MTFQEFSQMFPAEKAAAFGSGHVIWPCLEVFFLRNCGGVAIKAA
jgi:hypothetical protein